jgi:hypothetical protein
MRAKLKMLWNIRVMMARKISVPHKFMGEHAVRAIAKGFAGRRGLGSYRLLNPGNTRVTTFDDCAAPIHTGGIQPASRRFNGG